MVATSIFLPIVELINILSDDIFVIKFPQIIAQFNYKILVHTTINNYTKNSNYNLPES